MGILIEMVTETADYFCTKLEDDTYEDVKEHVVRSDAKKHVIRRNCPNLGRFRPK